MILDCKNCGKLASTIFPKCQHCGEDPTIKTKRIPSSPSLKPHAQNSPIVVIHHPPKNINNKSHIPFCSHCKIYVSPQVAVVTERRIGGIIDTGGPMDYFVTKSAEKTKKYCPNCGNEVFSQDELHAIEDKKEAETAILSILLILMGIMMVFITIIAIA